MNKWSYIFAISGILLALSLTSCNEGSSANPTVSCAGVVVDGSSCALTKNMSMSINGGDWLIEKSDVTRQNIYTTFDGQQQTYQESQVTNDANGNMILTLNHNKESFPEYNAVVKQSDFFPSGKVISKQLINVEDMPHGIIQFVVKMPDYVTGTFPLLLLYRYADDVNGFTPSGQAFKNSTWPRDGAIDVFAFVAGSKNTDLNNQIYTTLHYGNGWFSESAQVNVFSPALHIRHSNQENAAFFTSLANSYHTYAIEWNCINKAHSLTKTCEINSYLDGKIRTDSAGNPYTFNTSSDTTMDQSFNRGGAKDRGFNIIMNLATGGNVFGDNAHGKSGINTNKDLTMSIKSVKVYKVGQ